MFIFLTFVNSTEEGHICRPPQLGAWAGFYFYSFFFFFFFAFFIHPRAAGSERGEKELSLSGCREQEQGSRCLIFGSGEKEKGRAFQRGGWWRRSGKPISPFFFLIPGMTSIRFALLVMNCSFLFLIVHGSWWLKTTCISLFWNASNKDPLLLLFFF